MAEARTRKSELTKAAILAAARRLFAERGYQGTSLRDVAAAASIDVALVARYFGGKDELFTRASDFDLALPDLAAVDPSRAGETLARHFLTVWEGPGGGGMIALIRSASSSDAAAATMRTVFETQVAPAVAKMLRRRGGVDRAAMVASQVLGLAVGRYILKLPALAQMDEEAVIRHLGGAIQAVLSDAA